MKPSSSASMRMSGARMSYALAAPAFILLLALEILPALSIFVVSMTDWQFGSSKISFVGARNFAAFADDETFQRSLVNTLAFVATAVPVTALIGLAIALLVESGKTLRAFYRAVHFLPFMATMVAMAMAWEALLHPTVGLVNQLMVLAGLSPVNWLREETTALPLLGVIFVWQNLGYAMILFLAGLKAIPSELYDAAEVDGADGSFSRLGLVTLPLLGPVGMFVLIVLAVRAFGTFDTVKVLTQGGPGEASEMLLHTLYVESFEFFRTGYGAAIAVVFLLIIIVLMLAQAKVFDKRVHYQ